MATKKDERSMNYAFIVYPESCPENWESILSEHHTAWAHSPLHSPDPEEKKPHYHVMFKFDGNKSIDQVWEISKSVNGTRPFKLSSTRGYYRYLIHLDDPDKEQFNPCQIKEFCGFNGEDYLTSTRKQDEIYICEIIQFIKDNDICYYDELFEHAMTTHRDTWFPILLYQSTYCINTYITSRRKHRKDDLTNDF